MIYFNDHFIFKTMCICVGSKFFVSHRRHHKPRHIYGISPLGTMSDHNWRVFHLRRDPSLLANTRYVFSLPLYSTVRLYWTLPHFTEPTQSSTKRSVHSSTMHSYPFHTMSSCICNAICHCMLYHVACIMNATWTTQSTPLTGCHGQSHHPQAAYDFYTPFHSYQYIIQAYINIHMQHVILCSSNDTHTQSSHLMVIAHTNSSHVNTLEYSH